MVLIRSVEINYFRSIYRAKLAGLRALNILSGRNDAGKSTALKALNLFFNGQTDWQTPIDFYRDFSQARLSQVRQESVKGRQFIRVTIDFERPATYSGSLPESFRIARTWYRGSSLYDESNNLETLAKQGKLPGKLETARRFVAMLLNRIYFEYVPAVKDRTYHEHLLTRLQSALLDIPMGPDSAISQTAGHLATHIQQRIVRLQEDFQRGTGIASSIVPPAELSALFQAFVVSTESGAHRIPLRLRGDGIQARYVPSVLSYIAENSNSNFLWGFEEPENSLEYSYATEMATDFSKVYAKKAQIFLTTHSPAFTSLRSEDSTCFRVLKKDSMSYVQQVWPKVGSEADSELNIEMGFLKLQEGLHATYVSQAEELKGAKDRLIEATKSAVEAAKPLVLTEGKYDKAILEAAWTKLNPLAPCPFLIRAADTAGGATPGGAAGVGMLGKMIEAFHPADGRRALALFDGDKLGLSVFGGLDRNFRAVDGRTDAKRHVNGVAFALVLPIPAGREVYADRQNIVIEYMFADNYLDTKNAEGHGLEFATPEVHLRVGNVQVPKDVAELGLDLTPSRSISAGKGVFADQVVPTLPAAAFDNFAPLFVQIRGFLGV